MFEDEQHGPAVQESMPELAYRLHWCGLVLVALIGAGGAAGWATGGLAAMSLVGFALLIANRDSFAGSMKVLAWRTSGWLLPVWVALAALGIGLAFPAYHGFTVDKQKLWELLPPPSALLPVTGPLKAAALETLLPISLFSAVLSAMLLCKSRLVFARAWAIIIFTAGGFAALGLVQFATHTDRVFWIIPLQSLNFFSTFPHPAQWSAFALLWMAAGLGLLAWLVRQRGWRWLSSEGWAIMAATFVLGLSIAVAGDPLYQMLALGVGSLGCLVMAWQTRIERLKAKHSAGLGFLAWIAVGLLLAGCAAQMVWQHRDGGWINYAGGSALHERIIEDTQTMWRQRPWFGWGAGSFRVVYSFFQGADQSPLYVAYARSDLWQSLAEHGIIGTLAWCIPALWVLGRLLWQRRLATFLIAPAGGIMAVILLTGVDFPLASPAVFFSFWLVLISLGRWSEVDQENTVSKPSEKRQMEQLRAKGQTLPPKPLPAK